MAILSQLLTEYNEQFSPYLVLHGASHGEVHVAQAVCDSRRMEQDALFCCIRGEKADGHDHAGQAVERGASALLVERLLPLDVPQLLSMDVRRDMGRIASLLYGCPSKKLSMFAVTGTNGKSTTTWIIRHMLQSLGIKTGLFGTIVYNDGLSERDADRTTPESCDIQRALGDMVRNGCTACVMETSSHGLCLGRLEGCSYDGAVFTNLSEEHLDFHHTLEEYYLAKRRLFTTYMKDGWQGAGNWDDPYGRRIVGEFSGNVRPFGLSEPRGAGVWAEEIDVGLERTTATFFFSDTGERYAVSTPLTGTFNVSNMLGATALLSGVLHERRAIVEALGSMIQVPGRLEKYFFSNGVCAIIDFAHTPFALKNILSALRPLCSGSLIALFGHGGERFKPNRPSLGRVAAQYADRVIITMDNPRGEDPAEIARQIEQGVLEARRGTVLSTILDREAAVFAALEGAKSGDVVVISGKGPEKHIVIGDRKIPYSDRDAVLAWAARKGVTWR